MCVWALGRSPIQPSHRPITAMPVDLDTLLFTHEDLRLGEGPYGSIRWPAGTDKAGRETVVPMTPKAAKPTPQDRSLRHAYRRRWAAERKRLSDVEVAAAGGWKTVEPSKTAYQQADPETMLLVVLGAVELRDVQ